MATEPEKKTMYHVEKFLPTECPKCRHALNSEGVDYKCLLGRIRETTGYDIIICSHCSNFTARVPLESWQVGDKQRAKELVQQGFVNLQEVVGYGTHAQDHHAVYAELLELRVQGILH